MSFAERTAMQAMLLQRQKEDFDEAELTYLRVEKAVVRLQENFRKKRKRDDDDDGGGETKVSTKFEDGDEDFGDAEEKEKEPRGLEDDFYSRCTSAIIYCCYNIGISFLSILKCLQHAMPKNDSPADVPINNITSANTGSAPAP